MHRVHSERQCRFGTVQRVPERRARSRTRALTRADLLHDPSLATEMPGDLRLLGLSGVGFELFLVRLELLLLDLVRPLHSGANLGPHV